MINAHSGVELSLTRAVAETVCDVRSRAALSPEERKQLEAQRKELRDDPEAEIIRTSIDRLVRNRPTLQ